MCSVIRKDQFVKNWTNDSNNCNNPKYRWNWMGWKTIEWDELLNLGVYAFVSLREDNGKDTKKTGQTSPLWKSGKEREREKKGRTARKITPF